MLTFWIITGVMAALVVALLVLPMVRMRGVGVIEAAPGYDLQVYKDQLQEVDRDLARGVIEASDADRIRVEISRRILAADARVKAGIKTGGKTGGTAGVSKSAAGGWLAVVLGASVMATTFLLYTALGAPGYGDLGLEYRIEQARLTHEKRPSQQAVEATAPPVTPAQLDPETQSLINQLREKVADRPNDLQGQTFLASYEAKIGNIAAARAAQARVLDLMGDKAGITEVMQMAELMIVAANGYVSPEAEALLRRVLDRNENHGPAQYYWGLMLVQIDRPDLGFRIWDHALRQAPQGAPWAEPIRQQIPELAWRAGIVDYAMPDGASPPLAGPDANDIRAAEGMNAQDRAEMIRSMVAGLADRLANQGGTVDEWARLITSLAVLGEDTQAQTAYNKASQVFVGDAPALQTLQQAAAQAGIGQ